MGGKDFTELPCLEEIYKSREYSTEILIFQIEQKSNDSCQDST